jgi:thiamine pyrophosphokinase
MSTIFLLVLLLGIWIRSFRKYVLFYEQSDATKVIFDPDQDKTDTQLATQLALQYSPDKILFFGATGKRIDHTLANIFGLLHIPQEISTCIIDRHSEIFLVRDRIDITGKKDDTVSVLSLSELKSLSYSGLFWNVEKQDKPALWSGICNKMTEERASVGVEKGLVLMIKSYD